MAEVRLVRLRMASAQTAWESTNTGRLEELLDAHDLRVPPGEDHRGFEWYYWVNLLRVRSKTLKGHTNAVNGVAFRPLDGKRIRFRLLRPDCAGLEDAATGQEVLCPQGPLPVP